MTRIFDGANDEIRVDIGNCNITGAITMVVVAKRTGSGYAALMGLHTSGGTATYWLEIADSGSGNIIDFSGKTDHALASATTDGWCLYAATKAAGTSTPRVHKYVYATDTWSHVNVGSTLADRSSVAGGTVRFGEWQDVDDFDGELAAAAIWGSSLSDAQLEMLPHSMTNWLASNPAGMWVFDQGVTAYPVSDWTGGGANESTRVGTSISGISAAPIGYGAPIIVGTTTESGGVVDATITGESATATAAGVAGTVAAVRTVAITGEAATATAAGLAGTLPGYPSVTSLDPQTFSDATSHNITLPTVDAGDGIIIVLTTDGSATVATPDGWEQLYTRANGSALRGGAYARIARGDEDATTVDFVTSASESAAAQVFRITNWNGTLAGIQVGISAEVTTGSTVDLPAVTPFWESAKTLWIGTLHTSTSQTVSSAPSNYTDLTQTSSAAATSGAQVITARREYEAASEDPGTFTMSGTGASKVYNTIAIAPSSVGPAREHFEITNGTTLWAGLYTSQPYAVTDTSITRAIIILHGASRTAHEYYGAARYNLRNDMAGVFIAAPHFAASEDDPETDQLFWGSLWDELGLSDSSLAWRISSGGVLDELITALNTSFPNLEGIIIAGHSGGGQMAHRYSATSTDGSLRYLVSAPSSYMYPGPERTDGVGGWAVPGSPSTYDDYKYGVQNLSSVSYVDAVGASNLVARLEDAIVSYIVGADDDDPADTSMDLSAEAAVQGAHRVERMALFLDYLGYFYGPGVYARHTEITPITGIAHDAAGMLGSAEALAVYLQDFTVPVGISGATATATAAGLAGAITTATSATISGEPATATAAGLDGTVTAVRVATIAGEPASATASGIAGAFSGSANATVAGELASATASGIAGTVATVRIATVSGETATATASGLAGAIVAENDRNVSGEPATATAAGLAGTVAAVRIATIAGTTATATATGLAGSMSGGAGVTIAGEPATATATGLDGTVAAVRTTSVTGEAATSTATGIDGTIATVRIVGVSGEAATSTATGLDGAVATVRIVTIFGEAATATAAGQAGSLDGAANVSVQGEPASATAAGVAGAIAAVRIVAITGVTGTADAAGLDGTVGAAIVATVSGATASATAVALSGAVAAVRVSTVSGEPATAVAAGTESTVAAVRITSISGALATATAAGVAGAVTTTDFIATKVTMTVYGSDTARVTVRGDELGLFIDGTDTDRITVLGE